MSDDTPDVEPRPSHWNDQTVDPMWVIELCERNGLDVDEFLDEYNLELPRND